MRVESGVIPGAGFTPVAKFESLSSQVLYRMRLPCGSNAQVRRQALWGVLKHGGGCDRMGKPE